MSSLAPLASAQPLQGLLALTFDVRMHAIRKRRLSARSARALGAGLWIAAFCALVVVTAGSAWNLL